MPPAHPSEAEQSWRSEVAAAKLLTHSNLTPEDWVSEQVWLEPVAHALGPPVRRPESLDGLDPDEPLLIEAASRFPALVEDWDWERLTVRGLQSLLPDTPVRLSDTDNDGRAVSVSLGAFADYMLTQGSAGPLSDDQPLAVFDSHIIDSSAGALLLGLYRTPDVPALDLRLGLLERLPGGPGGDFCPPVHYLLLGSARSVRY
jgi:hypothetical protein